MKIEELPITELTIMKIIWDADRPMQLADIYAQTKDVYNKKWQYQTVSTYIRSLVRRGFLHMKQAGRAYDYTPAISEEAYLESIMGYMADFWGKKSLRCLASNLRENEQLTDEEIREIEEILDESEQQ